MKKTIILFISILIYSQSYGQLDDDFSDGNLFDNPSWQGDVSDFAIIDEVLKLNAEDGGTSSLFTDVVFPDTVSWKMQLELDFAPSGSNQLMVVLASPNANTDEAYYIEVGETGSNDAFNFYKGTTLLGRTTEGLMGIEPAFALLNITYDKDKFWNFTIDYGTGVFQEELIIFDDSFTPSDYHFFGLSCKYTSTRKDKFYFDNIHIDTLRPDQEPPEFINAAAINEYQIKIEFSESITSSTANDINNYEISGDVQIQSVLWNESDAKVIYLITDTPLASGKVYQLMINGLSDALDNIITPITADISLIEKASVGDLIINEVLFNPVTGGSDYIEIYNKSEKTIILDSLILYNSQNQQTSYINTNKIIKGDQYFVFTEDKDQIINHYPNNDPDQILEYNIPSMNNDEGNIGLYFNSKNQIIMLDSFDYNESMHFYFIEDYNGVSLERINSDSDTNEKNNWRSASASYNFGSPGIKNSNALPSLDPTEEMFEIVTEVFSPDGDNFDDFMILQYNLKNNDYLVNISVFNSRGAPIIELVKNSTLSTTGTLIWDGINNEGSPSNIGIYVIHFDYVSTNGERGSFKKTVTLARQL